MAVVAIVRFALNPDIWLSPLMILGTQWYILFNVIAGRRAFPNDLRDVAAEFRRARLAVVAPGDPAGDLSLLPDRRDHGSGGSLERQHRRRERSAGATPSWQRHGLGAYIARRPSRRLSAASCWASP